MMKSNNTEIRPVAREYGRELTAEEIRIVSGADGSCTVKATFSQSSGADIEASCTWKF